MQKCKWAKVERYKSGKTTDYHFQPGGDYLLLLMMRAPMTPGTQAQSVRRKTIRTDPQPLSITARGGKMMHNNTRQRDIGVIGLLG